MCVTRKEPEWVIGAERELVLGNLTPGRTLRRKETYIDSKWAEDPTTERNRNCIPLQSIKKSMLLILS